MTIELPDSKAFFQTVWKIVCQIPFGQVFTYGQIASMIPAPDGVPPSDYERLAPRWVGDALNAVSFSDNTDIPWHRVVNSKGGISLPIESQAAITQRSRLRDENVAFDMRERVDLETFGWAGPNADWLDEHGLLPAKTLPGRSAENSAGQLPLF